MARPSTFNVYTTPRAVQPCTVAGCSHPETEPGSGLCWQHAKRQPKDRV